MAVNYDLLRLAEDQSLGQRQVQQNQVTQELMRRMLAERQANETMLRGQESLARGIESLPQAVSDGYSFRQKLRQDKRTPDEDIQGDPNMPGSMGSIMRGIPSSYHNPNMSARDAFPAISNPGFDMTQDATAAYRRDNFDMTRNPMPNAAEGGPSPRLDSGRTRNPPANPGDFQLEGGGRRPPPTDNGGSSSQRGASTDQDRDFYEQLAMQYLRQQGQA